MRQVSTVFVIVALQVLHSCPDRSNGLSHDISEHVNDANWHQNTIRVHPGWLAVKFPGPVIRLGLTS